MSGPTRRQLHDYAYNDRTRLPTSLDTTAGDGDWIVHAATYTAQGQPLTQRWGETAAKNLFVQYQYKSDSQRLFRIEVDDDTYGQDSHGHFRYHYEKNGNITQLQDRKNGLQVQCFSYDDLGRLKEAFISDNI